ncbi:MAG TPA: transposase [Pirellulaceae bacterium]|nr:transposase [Pirellulaceae bacterium]
MLNPLNWSVSLFGRAPLPPLAESDESLREVCESDGVRILEASAGSDSVVQFLVSTRPSAAPAQILRCLKGRWQYLIRKTHPAAFKRNYRIESVGSSSTDVIEKYIAGQLPRQGMADSRAQAMLARFQIDNPAVDMKRVRYTSYGQFTYNLHLVVVRESELLMDEPSLSANRDMILKVSARKELLLRRGGILSDHLHLALGRGIEQSSEEIALSHLNNLAFANGMTPCFRFGYYVGTFGAYDLGAVRVGLAESHGSAGTSPAGM